MTEIILNLLITCSLSLSLALVLVLSLRKVVRYFFGTQSAYGLWLIVPTTLLAIALPARRIAVTETFPDQLRIVGDSTEPIQVLSNIGASDVLITSYPLPDLSLILVGLWGLGVSVSLVFLGLGQWRFLSRLNLKPHKSGLYMTHKVHMGAAVTGIFKPKIILPMDFEIIYTERERALIIAHEEAHIKAGDLPTNFIAELAVCLNWFNPLIYISRSKFKVDQELACDARVLNKHQTSKRIYAETILKTQLRQNMSPLACNWPSLSAGHVKERISILTKQQPNSKRRFFGNGLCASMALLLGMTTWATQPAQIAYAQETDSVQTSNEHVFNALGEQLLKAIQDGKTQVALALIDVGPDVNYWQEGDGTPLIMSVDLGNYKIVDALLAAGADVNKFAKGDGNPMIAAAANGEVGLLRRLLEAGADVDGIVLGDETPLINAAAAGHLAAAEFLLTNGADVNLTVYAPTTRGNEMRSPLSEAQKYNRTAMMRLLKKHGAKI